MSSIKSQPPGFIVSFCGFKDHFYGPLFVLVCYPYFKNYSPPGISHPQNISGIQKQWRLSPKERGRGGRGVGVGGGQLKALFHHCAPHFPVISNEKLRSSHTWLGTIK